MTLYDIIINVLRDEYIHTRQRTWVYGYQLQQAHTKYGWIGSSGQRRARELAKDYKIYADHSEKYVKYCYVPEEEQALLRRLDEAGMYHRFNEALTAWEKKKQGVLQTSLL